MQIGEEERAKIREALLYLADSMILLNDIAKMHTCNDCGIQRNCNYCPRPGESVRYNCPLWQSEAEPKDSLTVGSKRIFFTIGDAVDRFLVFIEEVKKRPDIRQPISWALYQTWRWFDVHEKERTVSAR